MSRRVTWVLLCEGEQRHALDRPVLKLMTRRGMRECGKVLVRAHQGVRAALNDEIPAHGAWAGVLVILDADVHRREARRCHVLGKSPLEARGASRRVLGLLRA